MTLNGILNRWATKVQHATTEGWRSVPGSTAAEPGSRQREARRFPSVDALEQFCESVRTDTGATRIRVRSGMATDAIHADETTEDSIRAFVKRIDTERRRVQIDVEIPRESDPEKLTRLTIALTNTAKERFTRVWQDGHLAQHASEHPSRVEHLIERFTVPLTRKQRRDMVPVVSALDANSESQRAFDADVATKAARIGARKGGVWGIVAGILSGVLSGIATVWATSGWPWS